jgi:hypothetical protein
MNYEYHYHKLVERAKNRERVQGEYYEGHHIVPQCLYGPDTPENIVMLTIREHHIAHQLLAKMYPSSEKLQYANVMMGGRASRKHEWARKRWLAFGNHKQKNYFPILRGYKDWEDQAEHIWKMYIDEWMTTTEIENRTNIPIEQVRQSLKKYAAMKGRKETLAEAKAKKWSQCNSEKRKAFTPEQEKRRIEATKKADYSSRKGTRGGDKNPVFGLTWTQDVVQCPHCGFRGGVSGTKRWHFDNCKHKVINEKTKSQEH